MKSFSSRFLVILFLQDKSTMYLLTVLYNHQSFLVHVFLFHLVSIGNYITFVLLIANQKLTTSPLALLKPHNWALAVLASAG